MLAKAAARAFRHADRGADQGSRRAASRRRLAGESVVLQRREFLRLLALAAAAGAGLRPGASEARAAADLYDGPPFGNVSFLHLTDVPGQLPPLHFPAPPMILS